LWLSGSQIPRIQACGFARATAEAVGVAPGPGICPRVGHRNAPSDRSGNRPRDKFGDRSGGVLRDGKMTAVVR